MTSLRCVAGNGVLARYGELVLLCSTPRDVPGGGTGAEVDAALAALRQTAESDGDGNAFADSIAAAISGIAATDETAVVAIAVNPESLVVSIFGHAWAIVATEYGEQRLAPRTTPARGLRSTLPGTILTVRAGLGQMNESSPIERWTDLAQGVTRAGGFVFAIGSELPADCDDPTAASEPATDRRLERTAGSGSTAEPGPVPEPEAVFGPPELPAVAAAAVAVDTAAPFSSVLLSRSQPSSLFDDGAAKPAEVRQPLPIAVRPAEPPAPDVALSPHPPGEQHAVVLGVYCKNGHFDDPSTRYCAICGISMAQQTLTPRLGPRPPLGVLVLDDGSIFSLDSDYVLGRDPSRDAAVTAGTSRPLRIDDPEGLLSRVHARIGLDEWQVEVTDLGSANGTGVWGPQDVAWRSIPAQQPVVIRPGTQIAVGRRQFRYESHRNT